jgi:exopolysaccharide biosynthesis polyprenyl glycosylphosphotransferase
MARDQAQPPASGGAAPAAASLPGARDIRATPPSVLGRPITAALRRTASIAALLLIDVTGLALGLYGALALRDAYHGRTPLWGLLWEQPRQWLPFVGLVTLLVFARGGLYAERERRPGFMRVVSSLTVVAVLTVAFALASGHDFGSYAFAPTAVVLTALVIGSLRASYEAVTGDVMRAAGVRRHALLVGDREQVAQLQRVLGAGRSGIEYEFVGTVGVPGASRALPRLGDVDELPAILSRVRVDELVLADVDLDERALLDLVELAHRRGVKVRVAPRATQLITHRAEYVPGQGTPLFELRPPAFVGIDWAVKRVFDLTVSAAVVVVGLPLWLLVAAAIKLDSRGPVLYRDRRIGLNEHEFGMLKFRTMREGADRLQDELEGRNEADGPLFKIRSDPRVTRVGAFLRRFSIDEIPQVLNVLRGEMSIVGPRPLPVRDYEGLEDWHRKRYLVLPGMTGLWQIAGRSELSFDDLVRLDFYYLENWSLWLDVTVVLKTLPAVVRARGAY